MLETHVNSPQNDSRHERGPNDVLQRIFGYSQFRGQQADVIDAALDGRDCLVLMPTGGGKSLCYQIPALVRPGLAIVVSPLIALMHDQVLALRQLGVAAAYLNSSLSSAAQAQVFNDIRSGELDLIYVAPERLLQEQTLNTLTQTPLSLIAIDEAHCVSQWGHDFRQDYLELGMLNEKFPGVPRMALTATADQRTREEIIERLRLRDPERFVSGFDRPNIRYTVQTKTDGRQQLAAFLKGREKECGIVYCLSRAKVESTAQWLNKNGFTAFPYHAGLDSAVRARHQDSFLRDDGIIIVATIAFGMGIDKPDVRFVAHLDLPKSVEAYYQETGRAGRDGEPADAWMVYGLQDVVRLRQMLDSSEAGESHKRIERGKLDALLGWCEMTQCRRRALLAYFGDEQAEDCGNCDTCIKPPKTWDATIAAQQLLSCIYRTGQRFGAGHVIDVLTGKQTEKVAQHGHEKLSTFAIGSNIDPKRWRSVLRQLIVEGYVNADQERYGALVLSQTSRALLRGEIELRLREDVSADTTKTKKRTKATANLAPEDEALWEALRACRSSLAKEQGIPPYTVFHDATLMEMIEQRPATLSAMLEISGVGEVKLERYGADFLELLNRSDHEDDARAAG